MQAKYGDKYPTKTVEMEACPPNNPRFAAMWEKQYQLNHSKSVDILGIKYQDIKETMVDMAESLIENGLIPDNRAK